MRRDFSRIGWDRTRRIVPGGLQFVKPSRSGDSHLSQSHRRKRFPPSRVSHAGAARAHGSNRKRGKREEDEEEVCAAGGGACVQVAEGGKCRHVHASCRLDISCAWRSG